MLLPPTTSTLNDVLTTLDLQIPYNDEAQRQTFERRSLPPGTVLSEDNLYVIVVGQIKVEISTAQLTKVLNFAHKGSMVGLDTLYDLVGAGYHSTVLSYANVIVIPKLAARLEPVKYSWIAQAYSKYVRENNLKELHCGAPNAARRVAWFLLNVSKHQAAAGCNATSFQIIPSREEIASYLNTTLETISRSLHDFRRCGLIEIEGTRGRTITLKNFAKLEDLSTGILPSKITRVAA